MSLCYLVGAMSCYKDTPEYYEKAVEWRRIVTEELVRDTVIFDPTTVQTLDLDWNDQCIVELNLKELQRTSFIIANAENIEKSPGSIVELTYAYLNYIPIFWFGELTTPHPHIKRILGMNGYKTLDEAIRAAKVVYGKCWDEQYNSDHDDCDSDHDDYDSDYDDYWEAMEEYSRDEEERQYAMFEELKKQLN